MFGSLLVGTLSVPRSAITLTEVLISLGILAIGLLGVAALFPVGAYTCRRAKFRTTARRSAQATFNEVMARGILESGEVAGVGRC